jgi:hypothetical protein
MNPTSKKIDARNVVDLYLHNDQPMTCPKCGSRTEFESHPKLDIERHTCRCGNVFFAAIDAESLPDEFGNHRFTWAFSSYDRYGNPK